MIWATAALDRLKELARLGLSQSRIAEQLHVSRNAVAGASRRHTPPNEPPHEPPPPPKPEPKWPAAHECRYILDNGPWKGGKTPIWCAKRVMPGSPYCPDHHQRCYARFHHGTSSDRRGGS